MRIAMFYHSLVSDWNHGNAHFLRGIASELLARGHELRIFEPSDGWSRQNLIRDRGETAVTEFHRLFPALKSCEYSLETLDLESELDGIDLVLVHEWNARELVQRIGRHRARSGRYVLLFHDTHHRSVTDPESLSAYRLEEYDGVLAFGSCIRDIYERRGWGRRAWTWHEAADLRLFHPWPSPPRMDDLVWIGNWGDDERTAELQEFLLDPVRRLRLRASAFGVRYPKPGIHALGRAGIRYEGWLPNYRVPEVFSRYSVTVHIPRRPYVQALPGIPTIRPFEALACGIPLVSAPWDDTEGLFREGRDYLVARNRDEMIVRLRTVLADAPLARELSENGRRTIIERHTCAHRVNELMNIVGEIKYTPASACLTS
jgi:spore maturation protein CgeB